MGIVWHLNLQTAFSTQWALYLLAKNEQAQQKVFEDVKHDLDNMECGLIRGTVREALRMYPVAFFIGRQFAVDGTIENYTIPKDVRNNKLGKLIVIK